MTAPTRDNTCEELTSMREDDDGDFAEHPYSASIAEDQLPIQVNGNRRFAIQQFSPILAKTQTVHEVIVPIAFDCVKLIIVRAGSSRLFSESGSHRVKVGDAVVLAANTLCGAEPEGWVTTTTLYLDRDYLIDQVFWQYAAQFKDRLDASAFLDAHYTEPTQVIRLGEDRAALLMPWLDELAMLSAAGLAPARFYRAQALLFAVLDIVAPFLAVAGKRTITTQRSVVVPSQPRHRRFRPLRMDARQAAQMLHADFARPWKVADLAQEAHLSTSQLRRVFADAYGKSPIAYLTMIRVEQMAVLLRNTDHSVAAIAASVGWGDPDFAARQFRRSVGVSPSEYRRISRKTPLATYPE